MHMLRTLTRQTLQLAGPHATSQGQACTVLQKHACLFRMMEPAAVLVTGICEFFDMFFLAVFRSFSDVPLVHFALEEPSQVL